MTTKIGIFDSGSGGLTTLHAIRRLISDAEYYYIGDVEHCPYGDKSPAELLEITAKIVKRLENWGAELIVIACNTATTRCIHDLRRLFPSLTFVGTEPAVKVAYDSDAKHPLLLATPATSRAASVQRLVEHYYPNSPIFIGSDSPYQNVVNFTTPQITILPCPGLADTIEQSLNLPHELILTSKDTLPEIKFNSTADIHTQLEQLISTIPNRTAFDSIILGCTHYILIQDFLRQYFQHAQFINGNQGVAQYIKSIILKRQK